jgi:hypothetical protein
MGHGNGKTDTNAHIRVGKSAGKPVVPDPNPEWHPVAIGMYRALKMSGQAQWYETTDWAIAWVMCEALDRLYQFGFTAGLLSEFNEMSSRLLCCEGDRRKARIELIKAGGDVDEDESEMSLGDIRKMLKGSANA